MLRGVVLLCLLVTPAVAETYTKQDCEFIEMRLNSCAEGPSQEGAFCMGIKNTGAGRMLGAFWDRHPALVRHCPEEGRGQLDCKSEKAFQALCDKVCHQEMPV